MAEAWAEASFEQRQAIDAPYRDYTHGMLWFLKTDVIFLAAGFLAAGKELEAARPIHGTIPSLIASALRSDFRGIRRNFWYSRDSLIQLGEFVSDGGDSDSYLSPLK